MPLLVLLIFAVAAGLTVGFATWSYPKIPAAPSPTTAAARTVGESIGSHRRLRAFVETRLDPAAATGLAMTVALLLAVGGGVLLGGLAYLVRSNTDLLAIDRGVANWGNRHSSPMTMHVLNDITQLGSIYTIIALGIVLAIAETIREESVWVIPFIAVVIGGEELVTNTVKQLIDRVRPTFNPVAVTLGPSFPSGHSATAAAFYATAALLLGRWRARPARAVLAGLAVGIAVGVAASRVLLDVHWLSDVIAGLALGWSWFAVCAIAFGGRILRFGAAAEVTGRAVDETMVEPSAEDEQRPGPPARPGPRGVLR